MKNNLFTKTKPDENKMKEFEQNVKINMKRAYFTALGFTGSHESALELSQEAFIRAYKNYNKFNPDRKFFTWYYKILKNLCLNFIRDSKKYNNVSFLDSTDNLPANSTPQQDLERDETGKLVQEALLKLNFEDREIIILKEFQGLSYKEISELLNLPEGTVMSKLFYARKKLLKLLKGVL